MVIVRICRFRGLWVGAYVCVRVCFNRDSWNNRRHFGARTKPYHLGRLNVRVTWTSASNAPAYPYFELLDSLSPLVLGILSVHPPILKFKTASP